MNIKHYLKSFLLLFLFLVTSPAVSPAGDWETIGTAPDGAKLTRMNDYLILLTRSGQLKQWNPLSGKTDWADLGSADNTKAITAYSGKLFRIDSSNTLWLGDPQTPNLGWKRIGVAGSMIDMAATQGKIFGVTVNNKLWARAAASRQMNWQSVGRVSNVLALTASDTQLFIATTDQRLWAKDLNNLGGAPADMGTVQDMVSIAALGNYMYGLTGGGQVMKKSISTMSLTAPAPPPVVAQRTPSRHRTQPQVSGDRPGVSGDRRNDDVLSELPWLFPSEQKSRSRRRSRPSSSTPPTAPTPAPTPVPAPAPSSSPEVSFPEPGDFNNDDDLFGGIDSGQNIQVAEATTGHSIRGDKRPDNLQKKSPAGSTTPPPATTTPAANDKMMVFTSHPSFQTANRALKDIGARLVALEKQDKAANKTLQTTWAPHANELKTSLFPISQQAVMLLQSIPPGDPAVQQVHSLYLQSAFYLEQALKDWVQALAENNTQLFQQGVAKLTVYQQKYQAAKRATPGG